MKTRIMLGVAFVAISGVVVLIAQQRPAGPYTADQVGAGRAAFQTNCASCHAANLSGAEGPELASAIILAQEPTPSSKPRTRLSMQSRLVERQPQIAPLTALQRSRLNKVYSPFPVPRCAFLASPCSTPG